MILACTHSLTSIASPWRTAHYLGYRCAGRATPSSSGRGTGGLRTPRSSPLGPEWWSAPRQPCWPWHSSYLLTCYRSTHSRRSCRPSCTPPSWWWLLWMQQVLFVPQRRRRTSPAPPRQGRPRLAAASRTWLLASCCVLRCLQYWVTVLLLTLIWWVVVFLRRFALVFIELKVIALRYAWGSRGICFDHVRFQLPSSLQCYAWCLSLLFHTRHKVTWYMILGQFRVYC